MRAALERVRVFAVAIAALAVFAGCSKASPPARPSIYASAEAVEENFRGKPFVLGTDNAVAEVRPPGWDKGRWLKLPFWPCLAYMAVGKLLRYIVMTGALVGLADVLMRH